MSGDELMFGSADCGPEAVAAQCDHLGLRCVRVPPPTEDSLTVTRCDNGWLLQYGPRIEVVEEDDYAVAGDVKATADLLWRVLDFLGLGGSKHDPMRVRVVIHNQDGQEVETD